MWEKYCTRNIKLEISRKLGLLKLICSHIHSLIQQTLIKLNVYWVLDVFPSRQWYASQCLIIMNSPPRILTYSMCSHHGQLQTTNVNVEVGRDAPN